MEAKDTVMSIRQVLEAVNQYPVNSDKAKNIHTIRSDEDITRLIVAQAEISFKAGFRYALEGAVIEGGYESVKKQGMKKVVEWAERNDPNNSFWDSRCWQDKLKDWGIEND